jgi:hypothetical protein
MSMSRSFHRVALIAGLLLATLSSPRSTKADQPTTAAAAMRQAGDAEDAAGDFLFTRMIRDERGRRVAFRIVAAKVRLDGFELRELPTNFGPNQCARMLHVTNGNVYAIDQSNLYAVDLQTGQKRELVRRLYSAWAQAGRIVFPPHDSDELVLYDLNAEKVVTRWPKAIRYALTPQGQPIAENRYALSPDGTRLAFYSVLPGAGRFALFFCDVQGVKTGSLVEFQYAGEINGIAVPHPPLAWLDRHRVVSVETIGERFARDARQVGFVMDVDSGERKVLANWPADAGSGWGISLPKVGKQPVFIIHNSTGRQDGTSMAVRGAVDWREGRFVAGPTRDGEFLLENGSLGTPSSDYYENADVLRNEDRVLTRPKLDSATTVKVSPDGQRVLWREHLANKPSRLCYFDHSDGKVRVVEEAINLAWSFMWCAPPAVLGEDLAAAPVDR